MPLTAPANGDSFDAFRRAHPDAPCAHAVVAGIVALVALRTRADHDDH